MQLTANRRSLGSDSRLATFVFSLFFDADSVVVLIAEPIVSDISRRTALLAFIFLENCHNEPKRKIQCRHNQYRVPQVLLVQTLHWRTCLPRLSRRDTGECPILGLAP
jgi:hypothetical protein